MWKTTTYAAAPFNGSLHTGLHNGAAAAAPKPPACKRMVDAPAVPAAELQLAFKRSRKLPRVCIWKIQRVLQRCLREGLREWRLKIQCRHRKRRRHRIASIKRNSAVSTLGSAYACPSGDSRLSSANVCSGSSSLIHLPHRQHVAPTPAGSLYTCGHHPKHAGRSWAPHRKRPAR